MWVSINNEQSIVPSQEWYGISTDGISTPTDGIYLTDGISTDGVSADGILTYGVWTDGISTDGISIDGRWHINMVGNPNPNDWQN